MRRGDLNLYVTSLDNAERFYADALGFEVTEAEETSRTMRSGEIAITLFLAKGAGTATRGTTPMMTADLLVDDLDAAVAAVEAAGGSAESIADWEHGRFAVIADPDGIGWELIEGSEA